MWVIQHLEDALSHVITLKKNKDAKREEADTKLKKQQFTPLGRAVRVAEREDLLSDSLTVELVSFYEDRNWLVHRSIAHNRDDWDKDTVFRKRLLNKIQKVTLRARKIHCLIEKEMIEFAEASGKDMSLARKEFEKYCGEFL